jgi:hypothetical protein
MKDEEHAHRDSHFQEELDFLKVCIACIVSLLEQTLRNTFGKGPSNHAVTFAQTQASIQPEERMSEYFCSIIQYFCINDTNTSS